MATSAASQVARCWNGVALGRANIQGNQVARRFLPGARASIPIKSGRAAEIRAECHSRAVLECLSLTEGGAAPTVLPGGARGYAPPGGWSGRRALGRGDVGAAADETNHYEAAQQQ